MSSEPVVLTTDEDRVRIITLNRPEKRNAFDLALRIELVKAIEAAMTDDQVRVLVLTGAGGAFCAGGDISIMAQLSREDALSRAELTQQVPRTLWAGTEPVLAAVGKRVRGGAVARAGLRPDRGRDRRPVRRGVQPDRIGGRRGGAGYVARPGWDQPGPSSS